MRFTKPNSSYSFTVGNSIQPRLRHRQNRCDQMRRTIQPSSRISISAWDTRSIPSGSIAESCCEEAYSCPRSHNPVSQKIKSLLDMNDPCLLWIQSHAQLFQYPSRSCQCGSRLRHRLAGDHPIIGEPCQPISFASHLLIERRQKYVTKQRRSDSALWGPALAGKEFPLAVATSLKHCLNQT